MPATSATAAPAPQLAAATRIVKREDGCLQVGIRPEATVCIRDTPAARRALDDIARGERCDRQHPDLLAALSQAGLFTTPRPPGRYPVRILGSLDGDLAAALRWSGLEANAQARLALVLSLGELDRRVLDPLIRSDVPHLIVRALDGVIVLGPFVVPGETACLRCLDTYSADEDPCYLTTLDRYVRACAQPREDGCLDIVNPGDAALALAWATRDLREYATGGIPTTWSTTIVIGDPSAPLNAVTWKPHPDCGCHWTSLA